MSNIEPTKNYIYQPFGTHGFKNPINPEKLYGVWALEDGSYGSIKGLTKEQAEKILAILNDKKEQTK